MCQQLGWLVKSELEPKQDFNFVGYQSDLRSDPVRLTPDRWQNLQEKMLKLLSLPACPVREFRSTWQQHLQEQPGPCKSNLVPSGKQVVYELSRT